LWLARVSSLVSCGKFLLDFESDGLGIYPADLGGGSGSLTTVWLRSSREQDDSFDDQLAEGAFVGLADKSGKQLDGGFPLLRFDALVSRDHLQPFVMGQSEQLFGSKAKRIWSFCAGLCRPTPQNYPDDVWTFPLLARARWVPSAFSNANDACCDHFRRKAITTEELGWMPSGFWRKSLVGDFQFFPRIWEEGQCKTEA
jgi:hypothetical protein